MNLKQAFESPPNYIGLTEIYPEQDTVYSYIYNACLRCVILILLILLNRLIRNNDN
jgi:hypothetical protein